MNGYNEPFLSSVDNYKLSCGNQYYLKEGKIVYYIKKFLGSEYNRINQIIDSFNYMTRSYVNLEACCSFPFKSVIKAQSAPTYLLPTEGVVGNRFFPEINCIDDIEKYSQSIILDLFELNHSKFKATTQPHSGTQSNQIVYNAILNDGDSVISLNTKSGGHISHNKFVKNIKVYNFGLTSNYDIDYEELKYLLITKRPKLVIIGASSFPNAIKYKLIIELAHKYGALVLADICHTVLFVLGKIHPSPFPDADFVSFTMDKTLRGPQGGILIYKSGFEKVINYSIFPQTQGGPLQSMQFAKLVGLAELQNINISEYAKQVQLNAKIMNETFLNNGYLTFSKDNSTHIILIDSTQFNLNGCEAEKLLFDNKILANKNIIPNDKQSPEITSGIRLGTTCITNQNYSQEDVRTLSKIIIQILNKQKYDKEMLNKIILKYN